MTLNHVPTRVWIRLALGVTLALLGCSEAPRPPVFVDPDRSLSYIWRGARVTGYRAAELPALLERAWPRVTARWPGWEPAGYTIEGWQTRIPCADAINGRPGGCRGTSTPGRKRIRLSWINGPADVVQVAAWEVCNVARWDLMGELRDIGCGY